MRRRQTRGSQRGSGQRLAGWSAAAMVLAGGVSVGVMSGCESAPPRQRAATIEAQRAQAAEAALPVDVGSVEEVTPLEVLSHASAEMGGPDQYTLALVQNEYELPQAVVDQGLEVDFETQSVVLLGMGTQPTSGYAATITGLQQVGDVLYVQAIFDRPGLGEMSAQVITTPWAAATVYKRPATTTLRSDFD